MEEPIVKNVKPALIDYFNEDITELEFLKSKPTCFIILGKPGCGKTTLAQKLAQIWRCEIIHSTSIIAREIDLQTQIGKSMQEVLCKGEPLSTEFVLQLIREKVNSPEVAHYGYVLDGMPTLDSDEMTTHQQLEVIKGWKLNPDFVINIKIPDIDLVARRTGMRVDSLTGEVFTRNLWDPPKVVGEVKVEVGEEEEEEEEEENVSSTEFGEVDIATKLRLVRSPENIEVHVEESINAYKEVALPTLENFMTDHNQQFLIELDGNRPQFTLFQQLTAKLATLTMRKASVPTRLQNPDEEELPDEIDTEELLRTLASYHNPAPRYRWKRSKWGRLCPVALKQGSLMQGKPDLAVSFLDKMYVLSSAEAMEKFLKNPRPFLLPPQPVPPCKVAVLGFPYSGKTTVAKQLADKYQAEVIDMRELMKGRFLEAREQLVKKAKQDALESALILVQNKLEQESLERAEARRKEAEQLAGGQGSEEDEDKEDDAASESILPTTEGSQASAEVREPSPVPAVTEDHHEVRKIVDEAEQYAQTQSIKIPPETYAETLKAAVDKLVADRKAKDPDAPSEGGWILDNFPEDKDQWSAMVEAALVPDDCIFLVDKSPNLEVIRKRFYDINKEEITEKYRNRIVETKRKNLESEMARLEEQIKAATLVESRDSSSDVNKESDPNVNDKEEESVAETATEDDADSTATARTEDPAKLNDRMQQLLKELSDLDGAYIGVPNYEDPEFQPLRTLLQDFDKEWGALQTAVASTTASKPLVVEILQKEAQEIVDLAAEKIEGRFGYKAWEFSGLDLDEEEEDAAADVGGEEEEGEEDEEALRHKKKHFGFTKHYDAVALKNEKVLWPGNPEIAAKYRERIYYFKSTDFREIFLQNPRQFIPKDTPLTPPPPRVLLLGARGAGKSLHGRWLAEKLGVFHISFHERLQELILGKTGRKLGAVHEESRLLRKEKSVSVEEAVKAAMANPEALSGEEEEEEKFSLEDSEEAIKANLEEDEALPPDLLNKIVPPWWREEPYKSKGFILEGFPRTSEEVQFLAQSGLFPDVALLLMVEDSDVIKRLLPGRMGMWRERREMKNLKKQKISDAKAKVKAEKMEKRRQELMIEREEKRAQRLAERNEQEEEEEEEEEDIEELLAIEFEEEEEGEEEEEEQEEEALERMKGEFGEMFDDDVNKLQQVQEQLEEVAIPRLEVQASRKPTIVQFLINIKVQPIVEQRQSLFERVYPLSVDVATKMLNSGYRHPSAFGRWDPVKVLESSDVIQPLHTPTSPAFPVAYNQYVYFLSSPETRNKFVADPLKFTFKQPPAKPVVPIQMAVLGPPHSGKTTIAERFALEFGAVKVSIGESIRVLLEEQPGTALSAHIREYLLGGKTVPDALAVEALATRLLDTTCTTRGYVLDGCPASGDQVKLLREKGIVPVKVVELEVDAKEVLRRAERKRDSTGREFPLHDSASITVTKHAAYKENIEPIRSFYERQHQNWFRLNGQRSKWNVWNSALELSKKSIVKIQDYLDLVSRGKAARLAELCISPHEFEARLSCYGNYCPVSLNLRGELVECNSPSLEFAVEFRSKYYKTASREDMELFLATPEKFVPPLAERELPPETLLPRRRTHAQAKAMFPTPVELCGYCPVSYHQGKQRYEALIEGNPDLVVEHRGKLFKFASEDKLCSFMRLPDLYSDLKLPYKLPPKKQPMDITSLPMLGYLEQRAATSIIKSLTAVGCFKPKFPFLSVERSALLYVACYLKAFNPRSPSYIRNKYREKLRQYEEKCELITYLGNNMTRRYKEPHARPRGFDNKMSLFLSLVDSEAKQRLVV